MNLKLLMTVTLEGFRDLEPQLTAFLKDFMEEHEKIFAEIHEHGLILESLLDVVDEAGTEALDTLTKDPNVKKLISKEVEINNTNRIIFEPTANVSRGSQIIAHASEEWYQVFSRYLRDAEIFGPLNDKQLNSSDREQVLSILNINKIEYLSTRKYDCRLTKGKIPYSGEVILVKDVFCVLASGSIIGNDSLVFWVPFSEIFELVSKNSFMGFGKELIIKAKVGDLELYMGDKNSRAALIESYNEKRRVKLESVDSLVAQRFKWCNKVINPNTGFPVNWAEQVDEL